MRHDNQLIRKGKVAPKGLVYLVTCMNVTI